MADEITGEGQASGGETQGSTSTDNVQQGNTQPQTSTQVSVPANNGWEAEKRAFIADLQKERKARQQYEQQANTHRTELELERKRVQALSGVTPRNAQETEVEEVRARFAQLFPHLADLTPEDIKELRASREQSGQLQETTNHYWRTHADGMVNQVGAAIAEELGGELSARQLKAIRVAYVQAAQDDPEFLRRHTAGDQTLIKEFAKDFSEDWLKPAQRRAQATELGRNRPVPMGKDRSVLTSTGKKIDVNNAKEVEDMMVESFLRRGGSFGR